MLTKADEGGEAKSDRGGMEHKRMDWVGKAKQIKGYF